MNEQIYLEKLLTIIQDTYARFANSDYKSMSTSRDALEVILDSIFRTDKMIIPLKKDGHPNPWSMINTLGKLKDDKDKFIYEEFIVYQMQIVRVYGNMASHPSKFTTNKKDQYIVFFYILRIIAWYCKRYGLTGYPVYTKAKEYLKDFESAEVKSSAPGNAQYLSDLEFLTNNSYNYHPLINSKKSLLIVTGSHVIAEMLDRPIAEMLREEINKSSSLKAIIISDHQYLVDAEMHSLSVISIGGPNMNYLTKEIAEIGDQSDYEGMKKAYREVNKTRQVALWAENSTVQTRVCVERFISDEDGLKKFISSFDLRN